MTITPPPAGTLYSESLALVVSPKGAGAGASAQGKHHALKNMSLEGSNRMLQLAYLPGGDYLAHIFPSSVVREFTIQPAEVGDLSIDLSSMAEVSLWPVAAEGEPHPGESPVAPGRLRWRVMADGIEAGDEGSGILAGTGLIQLPATWSGGAWRLLSIPGEFTAVVESYDKGVGLGQVDPGPVVAGPNDIIVELKPASGYRMEILVEGAPQDWSTRRSLAAELLEAVRPTQGAGSASFVDVTAHGKGATGLLAQVELTAPGEYPLECSAAWAGKVVPVDAKTSAGVKAGEVVKLGMRWQD